MSQKLLFLIKKGLREDSEDSLDPPLVGDVNSSRNQYY